MKKLFNFLFITLGVFFIFFSINVSTMIKAASISSYTKLLPNGDYIETTIEEETFPFFQVFSKEKTKTGTKTSQYIASSGNTLWTVSVHGTFTYVEDVSSKCTKSTVSTTCPSSNWKITSSSAGKSGNTATAKATGTKRTNTSKSKTIEVLLTCNKNGVLH